MVGVNERMSRSRVSSLGGITTSSPSPAPWLSSSEVDTRGWINPGHLAAAMYDNSSMS